MAVRTKVDISVQVGAESDLNNCLFSRELSELLDTMEDSKDETGLLAAAETNRSIDLGDVQQVRLVYIEADAEIDVSFGGAAATAAIVTGSGGTFPTGFVGGETLDVEIDNLGVVNVIFTAGASTAQDVANEINAAFANAGILSGGVPVAPATVVGGEVRLTSPTTGISSEVDITAGGTSLATLGLTAGVTNGVNAEAGTSQYSLQRMADPSGTSISGLKAYLLATIRATSVLLTNPDTVNAVRYRVLVVGDLVT